MDTGMSAGAGPRTDGISMMAAAAADDRRSRHRAVLLFYCYAPLPDEQQREQLAEWYRTECAARQLYGRVRVARDGVNATLGGSESALRSLVEAHEGASSPPPPSLPADRVASIDFKLQLEEDEKEEQRQQHQRRRAAAEGEAHFDPQKGVQVRVVDELVTWGALASWAASPLEPIRTTTAATNNSAPFPTHLAPQQFHDLLDAARLNGGLDPATNAPLVLLDARNAYESALGAFAVPGVPTLDPRTRRLAELPAWLDAHERLLARRTVLTFCTGGVRCERAAALLRARGVGFSRVAQLEGGIQRYLEAFPGDGGFFAGRNFVFDARGGQGVGPAGSSRGGGGGGAATEEGGEATASVVGRCAACGGTGGSYGARRRCSHCRMLLLLCSACEGKEGQGAEGEANAPPLLPPCALCAKRRRAGQDGGDDDDDDDDDDGAPLPLGAPCSSLPPSPSSSRRPPLPRTLRLLCLHGFRSTAGQLRARLRPLERALEGVAELVFCEGAPLVLPLWYRAPPATALPSEPLVKPLPPPFPKRAWLASARVLEASEAAARSGAPSRWEPAPDWLGEEEDDCEGHQARSPLLPRGAAARQDQGWEATVAALAQTAGPFDGALGFSQGAAVLAGLHALKQHPPEGGLTDVERAACDAVGRFAVLICGFAPAATRPLAALERAATAAAVAAEAEAAAASLSPPPPMLLQAPSLHVFSAEGGGDSGGHAAYVPGEASWALARLFEPSRRAVLRMEGAGSSGGGRGGGGDESRAKGRQMLLPVTPARVARVRQFLLDVAAPAVMEERIG